MWKCEKCGYETNRACNFKTHILRKTPCDVVKNSEFMLEKMKNEYESKWEELNALLNEADKSPTLEKLAEFHFLIKRRFRTLEAYGRKLDKEFDETEFNELKATAIKRLNIKKAELISFD